MLKRGTQVSLFAAESERWATYLRIRRKKKRVLSLPSPGAFGGSFTYEPNLPEKDK